MRKIKTKDILLVTIQFILLTIFYIPFITYAFKTPFILKYTGVVISVLGFLIIVIAILQLNKNLIPFPTPKENGSLINTGLYKYVRHPIYSGIFLAAIGIAFYTGSYWQLAISFILLILFYYKSKYEESLLIEKYNEYENYKEGTRLFF
ncbi:MAG: isoprenylcysteine carboxylmethyltransferase family protein [Bacteroidetes bacterium]|nr:isoprenylcysteine carboxylmethyltransferase family protein [Bacteroidota bacterium]MCA6444384.1 isoprenylcysteine carboxylmethyltransferase family protein [Bacteroidota bacterium]